MKLHRLTFLEEQILNVAKDWEWRTVDTIRHNLTHFRKGKNKRETLKAFNPAVHKLIQLGLLNTSANEELELTVKRSFAWSDVESETSSDSTNPLNPIQWEWSEDPEEIG